MWSRACVLQKLATTDHWELHETSSDQQQENKDKVSDTNVKGFMSDNIIIKTLFQLEV